MNEVILFLYVSVAPADEVLVISGIASVFVARAMTAFVVTCNCLKWFSFVNVSG